MPRAPRQLSGARCAVATKAEAGTAIEVWRCVACFAIENDHGKLQHLCVETESSETDFECPAPLPILASFHATIRSCDWSAMDAMLCDCPLLRSSPVGCSTATPNRECRQSAGACGSSLPQLRVRTRPCRDSGVCRSSTVRKDGSAESRGLKAVDPSQPTLREQFASQKQQGVRCS